MNRTRLTAPSAPSASSCRVRAASGEWNRHEHEPTFSPGRRASAAATSPTSAAFIMNGFSDSTCFPAAIASSTCRLCRYGGVATYTASTSSLLRSSR